jgi:hypothetical protein
LYFQILIRNLIVENILVPIFAEHVLVGCNSLIFPNFLSKYLCQEEVFEFFELGQLGHTVRIIYTHERRNGMKRSCLTIVGIFAILTSLVGIAGAQMVTPGFIPHDEDLAAVTYRSFANTGEGEIYIGVPDLGEVANREETDITWVVPGDNNITFSYDRANDMLTTTVVNTEGTFTLVYPNLSSQIAALGKTFTVDDLNIMQIDVVNRDEATIADFVNVDLDGNSLGDFVSSGFETWMVSDYDFSQGFTITGKLILEGSFSNDQELSKLQIMVGHLAPTVEVKVDIKPGSCPNPLNLKSRGVLPVAILGTESFDVTTTDVSSILLSRDGNGAGVAPIRWSYEDVATPFGGEFCGCHELGPDGFMDFTLKFRTQEVVGVIGGVEDGEKIVLVLTGNLFDETPFGGADCVRILKKGKKNLDGEVDLTGEWASSLKVMGPNGKGWYIVRGKCWVMNIGDIPAGKFEAQVYYSPTGALDGNEEAVLNNPKRIPKLLPGKKKRVNFNYKTDEYPLGTFFLVVDEVNAIVEPEESNNVIPNP